jgi:hypothetical protein
MPQLDDADLKFNNSSNYNAYEDDDRSKYQNKFSSFKDSRRDNFDSSLNRDGNYNRFSAGRFDIDRFSNNNRSFNRKPRENQND